MDTRRSYPQHGSMNRAVRQRENDGWPQQHPQLPILGAMRREGDAVARSQNAHNPGHDLPRGAPQQVRSPTGPHREWTAPPSNLDTVPEPLYNPDPPTPQREQVTNAQGLNSWHRETLQSLPRNVHMPVNDGNSPHALTIHVPFSREPRDLTRFVEKIGEYVDKQGGFADVWRCTLSRKDGGSGRELVAVKCIRLLECDQSQEEMDKVIHRLRAEVHLWVRLTHHQHVLPLYGTTTGFGPLPALVSPWAENGTLTKYIGSNRQLSYDRRFKIILQVISGLHHLHSSKICHGDLTGSNILINKNGDALISDFGLSAIVAEFNHTSYFKSCKPGAWRWADTQLFIDSVERTTARCLEQTSKTTSTLWVV
ncbi:kinase-like domain-containing protein [Pisolithus marmoratus]|nr:kinase-like domain-containing protein [Pisolithus marmoratus]